MIKKSLVALCILSGFAGSASAQWAVIDPANLVQNIISALQTVQQVGQAIKQTEQQIAMAKKMANDIKGLKVDALLADADPEMSRQVTNLEAAYKDYQRVQTTLGSLQHRMEVKVNAASSLGMTTAQFFQKQINEAKAGNSAADSIVKRDMQAVQGAQSVIKQAQQWRSQIGGLNENLGGSMQLANTQLNQLAVTNAEMLTFMAEERNDRQTALATQQAKDAAEAQAAINDLAPAAEARTKAANSLKAGFDHPITNLFQPN